VGEEPKEKPEEAKPEIEGMDPKDRKEVLLKSGDKMTLAALMPEKDGNNAAVFMEGVHDFFCVGIRRFKDPKTGQPKANIEFASSLAPNMAPPLIPVIVNFIQQRAAKAELERRKKGGLILPDHLKNEGQKPNVLRATQMPMRTPFRPPQGKPKRRR